VVSSCSISCPQPQLVAFRSQVDDRATYFVVQVFKCFTDEAEQLQMPCITSGYTVDALLPSLSSPSANYKGSIRVERNEAECSCQGCDGASQTPLASDSYFVLQICRIRMQACHTITDSIYDILKFITKVLSGQISLWVVLYITTDTVIHSLVMHSAPQLHIAIHGTVNEYQLSISNRIIIII